MNTQDKRYTATHEFNAEGTNKVFALRLAGDVIATYKTPSDAHDAAEKHEVNGFNKSPWELMTRLDSVLWLRKGRTFRIVYDADIRETKSDLQAAHWFGECVRHEIECNGGFES